MLPHHNTVCQAEIRAVKERMKFINIERITGNIKIFTDSRASIPKSESNSERSVAILRCKQEINNFSVVGSIGIIWVSGIIL